MIIGIDASRANREKKTGVEWYAWHLIEALKNRIPSDVTVRLYTDEPLRGQLAQLPDNWEEHYLRWPPKRLWTQVRMSIEMLRRPPDVLFIPAHVFPFIHPKRTVMTVHDVAAVRFPKAYSWFEWWYSLYIARAAMERLWKIIVPSQFTADEIADLTSVSSAKNVYVIHHGFDESYEKSIHWKQRDAIKKKYGIEKPFMLFVGRLETKKNTLALIRAFTYIKKKHDISLVLIGKPGHGYGSVARAIARHPHRADIIRPGWVRQDDMPTLMSAASSFVFPSYYEGFGIPVIEAMAAGVPVVAAEGSSLQEVGGDAATYINPTKPRAIADAVCRLLDDTVLAKKMIKKGKERVHAFSWTKCARQTDEVLRG